MYRDYLIAAEERRKSLYHDHHEDISKELHALYAYRLARIVFGIIAIFGLFVTGFDFAVNGAVTRLATIFFSSFAFAVGISFLTYIIAPLILDAELRRLYWSNCEPLMSLNRFDVMTPRAYVLARIRHLEGASFSLPLISLSLYFPLLVHGAIGWLFLDASLHSFGAWMLISSMIVGHAHLVLAFFSSFHVIKVQQELDDKTRIAGASRGFVALVWTVGASALPGILFLCIPPIIVALTGVLFIPSLYHWCAKRALKERLLIEKT